MIYLFYFVMLNIVCSFLTLAKFQNDEEGGDLMSLGAVILIGIVAGLPALIFICVIDEMYKNDMRKKK